jgi:predicted ATPase/DNA-binding SARP family transcriptional activator
MLEISTLGGLSLAVDGEAIPDLGSCKAEALLVYLAAAGRPCPRQVLAALLWPESSEEHALTSLRVALSSLRKAFGPYLDISRTTVSLRHDRDIRLDAAELESSLACGRLAEALRLYRGDFLEGFDVRDSVAFEEWRRWQQEALRRQLSTALHQGVLKAVESGAWETAAAFVHRLLDLEPLDEVAHQHAMRLLARAGQQAAALAHYQQWRRLLHDELDAQPAAETQQIYAQIAAGGQADGWPSQQRRHRLPAGQATFVGRERELAHLAALLADPGCRLLTLVGPGGIGKSRLALQAATRAESAFAEGACFVSLEAVPTAAYLIPAVAAALRLEVDTYITLSEPKAQLLDYLQSRSLLLLLDGFEHLIAAAGLLAEILSQAPGVRLLVTSRERLNVSGEWAFPVEGLPVAAEGADPDALGLFVARSRQANTRFTLDEAGRERALDICRLVEGMPLGIELAAAWTSRLSLDELGQEIRRNADFLASAMRDVPVRHQSLRATFDSTWRLLTAEQRETLGSLSRFRGGFDRAGALAIAGATLGQLSALLDKSLLRKDDAGRFDMHGLLRQYAAEKLSASPGLAGEVRERHAHYYAGFLGARETDFMGPRAMAARDEVRLELANVRAAVEWATTHWPAEPVRKLLTHLFAFYAVHGWHEGKDAFADLAEVRRAWLAGSKPAGEWRDPTYLVARIHQAFYHSQLGQIEESESISAACQDPLLELELGAELSESLHNLGLNATFRGDYERGRQLLEQASQLARQSEHVAWPCYLLWLGYVYFLVGEYEAGMVVFQDCYNAFHDRGNEWGMALALTKMGLAADGLGEYASAMHYHRQALAIFDRIDHRAGKGYCLSRMGMSAYFLEQYELAIELCQAGRDVFQEVGHRWGLSSALSRLGLAYLGAGDNVQARACFLEALNLARSSQMTPLLLFAAAGMASVWASEGDVERAAALFGYVRRHPETPAVYVEAAARWFAGRVPAVAAHRLLDHPLDALELDTLVEMLMNDGAPHPV